LRAGERLGIDSRHIIEVVLIHEAAHYLTHLGSATASGNCPY
jgi:hypothetical protein